MQREWKYLSFSDGDTRNIQKPESLKSLFTRRQTLKRKEPSAEEWTIYDQLLQDTSEEIADFSCLSTLDCFKALGSLIAWISACGAPGSTHALTLPSEPPRGERGGPPGCVRSGESGWRKERSKCIFTFFTVNVSHHIFCILYWFYM